MTQRLWSALAGERDDLVRRSETGKVNELLRAAWASHYADRGLLLLTFGWLALRIDKWTDAVQRPEEMYEATIWLGKLVFPSFPSALFWYSLVVVAFGCVVVCLIRPRWLLPRFILLATVLLVIVPEFGFGHMQHVDHLFLLGHVYSVVRPLGPPHRHDQLELRAKGYCWFLLGLLAIYTASGLWKIVDMTIRDVLKPGVTWLEPEAMLATSIASMKAVDLPMLVPGIIEDIAWIFPIGYVLLTFIFAASFLGAFRRPLLVIIVPTIAFFHLLNAVALYALFLSTILVAVVLLTPYDFILPNLKGKLTPVRSTRLEGKFADAVYYRTYVTGESDSFTGFYAYRALMRDRSLILSSPLYYPGVAWAGHRLLQLRKSSRQQSI